MIARTHTRTTNTTTTTIGDPQTLGQHHPIVVHLAVTHQIPFLPETQQTTLDTHESLLVRVDASMESHFVGDTERPTADVAVERFGAAVRGDMRPKCVLGLQAQIANGALEGQRVSARVGKQAGRLGECFGAQRTGVGSLCGMDGLVFVSVFLADKGFATFVARIVADSEVNGADVPTQCDVRAKGLGAGVAREWTFVGVDANVIGQSASGAQLSVAVWACEFGCDDGWDWMILLLCVLCV